jgi:riboflavin synthase
MFTGIVEQTVAVADVADHEGGRRLSLAVRWGDEREGESIAVNGCCLTVAQMGADRLHFDVIHETLRKTNLGRLAAGDPVHVERALRPSDRIDGHFVLGHVDGTAQLLEKTAGAREARLRLRVSEDLANYIMPRGSVCLDGVSLTVARHDGTDFEVALIPTTLGRTALGERPIGWPMNFEADILVKTVVATLRRMAQTPS